MKVGEIRLDFGGENLSGDQGPSINDKTVRMKTAQSSHQPSIFIQLVTKLQKALR